MNTHKETSAWLTGLLTGWGIREIWAKLIAGGLIGVLCAAGLLLPEDALTAPAPAEPATEQSATPPAGE